MYIIARLLVILWRVGVSLLQYSKRAKSCSITQELPGGVQVGLNRQTIKARVWGGVSDTWGGGEVRLVSVTSAWGETEGGLEGAEKN